MRKLPFEDNSFDVVVSHWVVHNLSDAGDRDNALSEMGRVLRPGGSLLLCDIEHRDEYLKKLQSVGLIECRLIFNPFKDFIVGALSFGSFRPTTLFARMPDSQ